MPKRAKNIQDVELEELKPPLLISFIREVKWAGKHPN
tara:strand:- start:420 stop:530 length:111 start_codon:yes stop_codon:yes gene_type:complete